MAENDLKRLQKELKFKKLQLNSIYELSSAMHSQFDVDHVMRIFFSSLMAPLGISRTFFFDPQPGASAQTRFRPERRRIPAAQEKAGKRRGGRGLRGCGRACRRHLDRPEKAAAGARHLHYLLNIAESKKKPIVLGLGRKFNLRELEQEDFEFACILSRFMLIELDNIRYLAQIFEKKKLEHEMKIARDIQLSLLPQELPELKHYDMAVIYETIQEVGGDYYDFLKKKKNIQPLVLADVEGKGLSAALLAASCQAIFHSMNELYLFKPATFIAKANSFIHEITRGSRFITLFWMLLNDDVPALTYVNAGHNAPYLVSAEATQAGCGRAAARFQRLQRLSGTDRGAAPRRCRSAPSPTGFSKCRTAAGEEFGEQAIADFIQANRSLSGGGVGRRACTNK